MRIVSSVSSPSRRKIRTGSYVCPVGIVFLVKAFSDGARPRVVNAPSAHEENGKRVVDSCKYKAAVDEFVDMVYRIAFNQVRNAADADDITQMVFIKLYRRPPQGADREHLKRWLIRVTVNECRSFRRAFWRRRVELREVDDGDLPAYVEPAFSEPDYTSLYEALDRLPEKCRIVVHLFYFEDCSTREIAGLLGIREVTVRNRLARARKQLRHQLKEAWKDV